MATLIITEKSSQAKDLRAALGDRYGRILPAEGHLLRLAEPDEVDPAWKRWSPTLLKPDGLYPTRPDQGGNKAAKLQAITAALRACDDVILATDCDREGQLIGQEILEHVGYRGKVRRALFTAQDPKTLRDAFAALKPNDSMRPLYEAAVARQQADQIYNLSLTRTATKTLLAPGTRGVIGIGRVKTPTLAIVCLRELEIRNFRPEDYYEVVATATVAEGSFQMRHAPAPKDRIKNRAAADAIARAADNHRGPLTVTVEEKRQAPPKLYDLPSLQKTCGQRWGWTADRTLAVAQELYDGDGKKLITYPRAEARYLSENQIADVPAIVGALTRLRGFAHLDDHMDIRRPVIRKGKSGHFCDKALEGLSHHAVIPNVNVLDDLESRLVRLTDDEKRLYALVCRSYLAAVMPDYEYRQTSVTMPVPVPTPDGTRPVAFRAVGRIPLKLGWKAAFGSAETDDRSGGKQEEEAEQTLPPLTDGEPATLSDPKVEAKRTQAPPRYNEGTLVDAMQNAWRFVGDPPLRDRLKEARGIGTPATRAEVIKGLRKQNLLGADGKWLVPTPAGLHLFETLRAAAPTLVDPGTTALWEMKLDEVVTGRADFRRVIDAIATEAERLIGALVGQRGTTLDLGLPAPKARFARRATGGRRSTAAEDGAAKPTRRRPRKAASPAAEGETAAPKPRRARKTKAAAPAAPASVQADGAQPSAPAAGSAPTNGHRRREPTERMVAFARSLAERKGIALPDPCLRDFDQCRSFLDQHAR